MNDGVSYSKGEKVKEKLIISYHNGDTIPARIKLMASSNGVEPEVIICRAVDAYLGTQFLPIVSDSFVGSSLDDLFVAHGLLKPKNKNMF